MSCSNLVRGSVPTLSSGHREVRICRYIIFRKSGNLLQFRILLVRPVPLIPKPYALLFPQHMIPRDPGCLSSAIAMSKNFRIENYWNTLLWRRVVCSPIIPSPTPSSVSPMEECRIHKSCASIFIQPLNSVNIFKNFFFYMSGRQIRVLKVS